MSARSEWFVEGPNGHLWIEARDSDDACEKYQARFSLPMFALDLMTVTDIRPVEQ